MKKYVTYFVTILITSIASAQHPGTGQEIAPRHGPSTPDAGSKDTAIMGGGTPGGEGGFEKKVEKRSPKMRQEQEVKKKSLENSKKREGPVGLGEEE